MVSVVRSGLDAVIVGDREKNVPRAQHMVASLEVGQTQRQYGRHPRRGGNRSLTLLQCSQSLLKSPDGRIGVAGIHIPIDFASKLCGGVLGGIKEEAGGGKDRLCVLALRGPPDARADSTGARPRIIKPLASLFRHDSVVVVQADNRPITGSQERTPPFGAVGARSLNRLQVLIIDVPREVLTVKYRRLETVDFGVTLA